VDRWQGHLPITSASLRSTLMRAARERLQFSSAERALFTACEFWVAVCSRQLAPHLGVGPLDALRYTSILYAALRADGVAAAIIVAINELEGTSDPQEQHQCLAKLQEQLLSTPDPVDHLIAHLAQTLGWGAGEQLETRVSVGSDRAHGAGFVTVGAPAHTNQPRGLEHAALVNLSTPIPAPRD
jgi:hypothetical protein